MSLKTVRLKPNPTGKDRSRYGATPGQLAAEWVDLQNTGARPVDLTGVTLKHIAYHAGATQGHWAAVQTFTGVLQPGQVMRIHAGRVRETSVIRAEDLVGADHHLFSGEDQYVWNNDRGDCSSLWLAGQQNHFDSACYNGVPPEGIILVRSGNALVVPAAAAVGAYRR